mgnify:CR=1 FL=1
MIKEVTFGEEKIIIDFAGAPLWKIWFLHIFLFVRFNKLFTTSEEEQTQK